VKTTDRMFDSPCGNSFIYVPVLNCLLLLSLNSSLLVNCVICEGQGWDTTVEFFLSAGPGYLAAKVIL